MGAPNAKALFAPVPIRAMAARLSGVEFATLICVASHDRMSLVYGKGTGCTASNNRIAAMTGYSYAKVCAALSALVESGLLKREQPGRKTVYRVIYNDDDKALFGTLDKAETCAQSGTNQQEIGSQSGTCREEIGYHPDKLSDGNHSPNQAEYIPLNGGINSSEEGGIYSSEEARLASRGSAKGSKGLGIGAELSRFERALKSDPQSLDLQSWIEWLGNIADEHSDDRQVSNWALRLVADAEDVLDFQRDLVDPAEVAHLLARTTRTMRVAA